MSEDIIDSMLGSLFQLFRWILEKLVKLCWWIIRVVFSLLWKLASELFRRFISRNKENPGTLDKES